MRKFKIVYYIIYAAYIGTSVYFALDIEAMFKQFGMFSFLKFLQYWAALGMFLLVFEWIVENIHLFQIRRRNKKLEKEIMTLKSELYELQKHKMSGDQTDHQLQPETVQLAPPAATPGSDADQLSNSEN